MNIKISFFQNQKLLKYFFNFIFDKRLFNFVLVNRRINLYFQRFKKELIEKNDLSDVLKKNLFFLLKIKICPLKVIFDGREFDFYKIIKKAYFYSNYFLTKKLLCLEKKYKDNQKENKVFLYIFEGIFQSKKLDFFNKIFKVFLKNQKKEIYSIFNSKNEQMIEYLFKNYDENFIKKGLKEICLRKNLKLFKKFFIEKEKKDFKNIDLLNIICFYADREMFDLFVQKKLKLLKINSEEEFMEKLAKFLEKARELCLKGKNTKIIESFKEKDFEFRFSL